MREPCLSAANVTKKTMMDATGTNPQNMRVPVQSMTLLRCRALLIALRSMTIAYDARARKIKR